MARILVTGGAGFIGSHIVEHYHKNHDVTVLDSLRTGHRKNLDGFDVTFVEGSITDRALVFEVMDGIDYVFHLGAMVSVPESMEKPDLCVEMNTTATLYLLEAARTYGIRKLVLSSSAAIYGDNPVMPKVETMVPEPKSPYAVTKLDGEYYLDMYRRAYGVPTVSLRYFNVYGPRQDPKSPYAAAVPIFIHRALRHEDITIFGDGEQTRDFVYVKDVVAANAFAAEGEADGVFNVARGGRITIKELAEEIVARTGSHSTIHYGPERAGDVKHSQADVGRLREAGFSAAYPFDEALDETIAYYRTQL